MLDHLLEVRVGDGLVELDGVPVALVCVIAGADGLVPGPKLERPRGIALEGDAPGLPGEKNESEHLVPDLEHGDVVSERVVLDRTVQPCAQIKYLVPGHATYRRASALGHVS